MYITSVLYFMFYFYFYSLLSTLDTAGTGTMDYELSTLELSILR